MWHNSNTYYYNTTNSKEGTLALRTIIFLLHGASAIFFAICATSCGASFISHSYTESISALHTGYIVKTLNSNNTCPNSRDKSCFFEIPQARDVAQPGLEWNVFALLAAFEWISASFALGHLGGDDVRSMCFIWNLAGGLWLMPYTTPMSLLQTGITVLALIIATSVQYFPLDNEDGSVVMHYTEYCTSASLLFVAVLILYVPEPASWAAIVGFTGILLCNLTGVCAHIARADAKAAARDEGEATNSNTTASILYPAGYYNNYSNYSNYYFPLTSSYFYKTFDMDWSNFRNHFKLYMMQAWTGLLMSIFIIVYVSWDSLSNSEVPGWVRYILINLLVTFVLFGVWAMLCYTLADTWSVQGGEWWASEGLAFGLSILSAVAKLPIAYTVFYGLIAAPGDKICSVF
jgi:hypothetical protein